MWSCSSPKAWGQPIAAVVLLRPPESDENYPVTDKRHGMLIISSRTRAGFLRKAITMSVAAQT